MDSPGRRLRGNNPYLITTVSRRVDDGDDTDNDSYVSDLTGITTDLVPGTPSRQAAAAIQAKSLFSSQQLSPERLLHQQQLQQQQHLGVSFEEETENDFGDEGDGDSEDDPRELLTANQSQAPASPPSQNNQESRQQQQHSALLDQNQQQQQQQQRVHFAQDVSPIRPTCSLDALMEDVDSVNFQDARQYFETASSVASIGSDHNIKGKSSNNISSLMMNRQKSARVKEIDFLQDDPKEMTWSRRIAIFMMKRYTWYNPRLGQEENQEEAEDVKSSEDVGETIMSADAALSKSLAGLENYPFSHSRIETPSLAKAWAFFEHVTLPRYILEPKENDVKKSLLVRVLHKFGKANKTLDRAEPGESQLPTCLYEWMFTPHNQLGDFGLGIGLYFSTLRALFVLTFLAGIVSIPNFLYFSGPDYSQGQKTLEGSMLKGSAYCDHQEWVPCPDCSFEITAFAQRLANGTDANGRNLTFAQKNRCEGPTIQQGLVNFGSLLVVILGTLALNVYLKYMEVKFDEDEQTAQDYSMIIHNPPDDATDPREWKEFFNRNFGHAHTTAITIAVDNDLLVRTLVERRETLRKIEMMVEPGTKLDMLTLARLAAKELRNRVWYQTLLAVVSPGISELFSKMVVLTARVQGLAQQDYPVTSVFITFETEASQRHVLEALSVGYVDVVRNNLSALQSPSHAFRGEFVLHVGEPEEPNTIRWQDLNEKWIDRMKQQAYTILCTLVSIVAIAFLIYFLNKRQGAVISAFAISIFNSVFPMVAKLLNSCESHGSEGDKQRSLYIKIALFRWVNTAVVITIITPFTNTISGGDASTVAKILALFVAEIVTTNAIQIVDPMAHINRHILAPRASTQDDMNIKFRGTPIELAERYTNMTKILFLCYWYSAIFPSAFFFCSLALFLNYFVDRFSLMRSWARVSQLGTSISQLSRTLFFSLAILAMALISSYYWSGFPFDNICEADPPDFDVTEWIGQNYTIFPINTKKPSNYSFLDESTPFFEYCLQDFLRYPTPAFPFVAQRQPEGKTWMTPQQEELTLIYGIATMTIMFAMAIAFILNVYRTISGFFRSDYDPRGDDQNINFSDVPSISAFVPQVESEVFSYPLLACSVDNIDLELLEWTDPDRPHSFYDLTKDADFLLRGMDMSSIQVFSQIYHYPPSLFSSSFKEGSPRAVN